MRPFARRWAAFTGRALAASLCWPWTQQGRGRFRRLASRVLDSGGFLIRECDLADVLPEVRAYDFQLARPLDTHPRAMDISEICVLGALLRAFGARRVFEFGTYRGYSALHMARLAPDAEFVTLDRAAELDFADDTDERRRVRIGELFHGKQEASRIRQVLCDSMRFDASEFAGVMELILVDGNHTYPYVQRDSENAFRMLAPRGAIVWDDYTECGGVQRYLDEIAPQHDLFRPRGTGLVVYLRR